MKRMIVQIRPDGKVKLETEGYHGPECVQRTAGILSKCKEITHSELKAEYFEETNQEQITEEQEEV